jgi:tripartite-type tricarboxylate transporter receptor subunit TctC
MLCRLVAAAFALLGLMPMVAAQDAYPTRPIKMFIGFPVGGLLDTIARIVAEKMGAQLGQQFVIEARSGANSNLAFAAVAKAEPDGYTLMMANDNLAINPSVMKNVPYDLGADFTAIGFVGSTPLVWNVHPSLGVRSLKELVALAKARDGTLTFGSVGPESAPHLATEMFLASASVRMQHVPYRGGAPALNDLLAGHLHTMMMSPVISKAHIEAGKLVPLALAGKQRVPVLPNVPTMAEAGYPIEAAYWFGVIGPARMPPVIVAKLERTLLEVLAMPDVRARLEDLGAIVQPLDANGFAAFIRAESRKWADFIRTANLQFE